MNLDDIDISKLPAEVRRELLQLDVSIAEKEIQNKAKNDFMSFVKAVWPEFIEGAHHRVIAQKFNDLATGKINRLIVNMPQTSYEIRVCKLLVTSVDGGP